MKLTLRPQESVLHPQPYVEEERNPLIITTLRVIETGPPRKELESVQITYAGKGTNQRVVFLMVLLAVIGLPFFAIGAYNYFTVKDKPLEPPKVEKGQPRKPLTKKELRVIQNNKQQFVVGIVLGVFGAAFLGGAYLCYKRRLQVVCGGGGRVLRIFAKDKMMQDRLLTMIGASRESAKALAPQPQQGPPPMAAAPGQR